MEQQISQKTAQQIVETVKDVCGQNINFIDHNGIIYASTDKSRVGKFHEIGKQVVLTGQTIEVKDDDSFYGTQAGVNIPILHHGELIAVIGISGDPEEVRKYAYLAQKITIILLREQELDYQINTQKNRINYVIRTLMDEEHSNDKRVKEYLKEKGVNESANYQVILVKLDTRYNPNNLALIENSVFQAFQVAGSQLYTFNYPNEYLLILEHEKYKKQKYVIENLAKQYDNILRIVVGDSHSLFEQYKSYQEAKVVLKSPKEQLVGEYSGLGIEMLCANLEEELSKLYQHKFLAELKEEEIQLLQTYYEEEMSLSRTSERLFVHKNTIQYQLDRIYKKSGFNPRNFKDAVGYYAALLLRK